MKNSMTLRHAMNVCNEDMKQMHMKLLEGRLDGDEDACEFRGNDDLRSEDSGGQLNEPHYSMRDVAQTVADT